ncbi:Protein of unknown function [Pedobacter rhizosphaerae]|uniref:Uncharacterized protein n=2 Tax=Pedobacter rhizosphaerae TaxID=390241 RepID=A0A1H9SN54_9SPHI|nr:nucleoside hydrolase-like domain-containing protein [Pedobacter rhizosphaerae]SER85803.1 Protein of unknown function [Pedobacter rhizosphaerae]
MRSVCKQGAIPIASFKGYDKPTEGSKWIIECAKKKDRRPLWVLVWGGLEDLAQALHDAPQIQNNIRVYWIGGPNKKWSVNAYAYIAQHFPHLWMIEANAAYRGLIIDAEAAENFRSHTFFENNIKGNGEMGKAFINYYGGRPKMGDTPSLAYLMHGNPEQLEGECWGGSFTPINRSSRHIFYRHTTLADTVPAYGVVEWHFKGMERNLADTIVCFTMKIAGQEFPGYYLGSGKYGIRYTSKAPETLSYVITSKYPELNDKTGQLVSNVPWPGKPAKQDYILGRNWYSDRKEPELFLNKQQGAKTIARYREAFLADWAIRWEWLRTKD